MLQNVGASTVGTTIFEGTLRADAVSTEDLNVTQIQASHVQTSTIKAVTSISTDNNIYCDGSIYGQFDYGEYLPVSIPSLSVGSISQQTGKTADLDTVMTSSISNAGTLSNEGDALFATNITQTAGTADLDVVVTSRISNAGTLSNTGSATFATNITQSAGTASLKAVTATSISNTGTLSNTGVATFATNITQSAGTASLKAVSATGITNTGNQTITGTLSVTGNTTLKVVTADSVAVSGSLTAAYYSSSAKPHMSLYLGLSSTQSISATTWTPVKFDGILNDNGTVSNDTTSPYDYTNSGVGLKYDKTTWTFQNTSGKSKVFLISGAIRWASNTTGYRGVRVRTGGTSNTPPNLTGTIYGSDFRNTTDAASLMNYGVSVYLLSNQYFNIEVYVGPGGLSIQSSSNDYTYVSIVEIA